MQRRHIAKNTIASLFFFFEIISLSMIHADVFAEGKHKSSKIEKYALDANAIGVLQKINNISNLTIVSKDENDLKAEYRAGFIQGRLQGKTILSARDNAWSASYLTDPSHSFPKKRIPSLQELNGTANILTKNYASFIKYINDSKNNSLVTYRLKRLLFRMLGIYHGAILTTPKALDFSGKWTPNLDYFHSKELSLGYETNSLTFMDIYFINAYPDLMDIVAFEPNLIENNQKGSTLGADRCSAFLKRTANDVILAHNTWAGFLSQTMVQTIVVNKDILTVNAFSPGLILSGTDFGYNNKGVLFNETTINSTKTQIKPDGLLTFWREALAETFASSIEEFFSYLSIDNTGSYLNSYMLVDAKTNQTGFFEASQRCIVQYMSTGDRYHVTSKSLDGQSCGIEYDSEMLTPKYIMGINYPVSLQMRKDLEPIDNRPARKKQFKQFLPTVNNITDAKTLITYTDPTNPLSIFGRWDLGYGETDYPKQVPDGAIDAKVVSSQMVRDFMQLSGTLDVQSKKTNFWMLFGTAHVNGAPFIWSQSSWKWQKLKDVPDQVDGQFTLIPMLLK